MNTLLSGDNNAIGSGFWLWGGQSNITGTNIGILSPLNSKLPLFQKAIWGIVKNNLQSKLPTILKSNTNPDWLSTSDISGAISFVHDVKSGSGITELIKTYSPLWMWEPSDIQNHYNYIKKNMPDNPSISQQIPWAIWYGALWIWTAFGLKSIFGNKLPETLSTQPVVGWGNLTTKDANTATKLVNTLFKWIDPAKNEEQIMWWQIISKLANPNTKTYKDLYQQLPQIKQKYYNQPIEFNGQSTTFGNALESIPVKDNKLSIDLINNMRWNLTDVSWQPSFGHEDLFNELWVTLDKFQQWKATLKDQTEIKTMINKFNQVWTEWWKEKWWLTAQWYNNVYKKIQWQIETTAADAWLWWVKEFNQWYSAITEVEKPLYNMAKWVAKETATLVKPWFTQKVWTAVGKVIDWVSGWSIKWALKWLGVVWENSSKASSLDIEKQLPSILNKLSKTLPEINWAMWTILWRVWQLWKGVLSADPTGILSQIIIESLSNKDLTGSQVQDYVNLRWQWMSTDEAWNEARKIKPIKWQENNPIAILHA